MKKNCFIFLLILLLVSCSRTNQNKPEMIIKSKDEINLKLSKAVTEQNADTVKLLISYGADINYCDTENPYPLLLTSLINEDNEISKLLIDAGANVKYTNSYNYDYFQICMNNEKYACIELLLNDKDFIQFLSAKNNFWQVMLYCWNKNPEKSEYYIEKVLQKCTVPFPDENLIKIAIDENCLSAIQWLYANNYPVTSSFWDDFSESVVTPENYAIETLDRLKRYNGKDYNLNESDNEFKKAEQILEYIKTWK